MDDPAFTQPKMYEVIRNRRSIPDCYADVVIVSSQRALANMKTLMIYEINVIHDLSSFLLCDKTSFESFSQENNVCGRQELNDAVAEWNNTLTDQLSQVDSHVPKVC